MQADEVRKHLASLLVGEPKVITLGPHDTPKAVRNYFLVIAKNEGYVIQTRQREGDVLVTLTGRTTPENKKPIREGLNGYYRRNRPEDFNYPALSLRNIEGMLKQMDRIDMSPKPRVGFEAPTVRRKE